jgi:protein ImuA
MMGISEARKEIISQLRKDILHREGFKPLSASQKLIKGLEVIEAAFPDGIFPTGTMHEFLNFEPEHAAASGGFITGLLAALMRRGGSCLWLSASRKVFPSALKAFGVDPDQIIFVDLWREKEVLWATEEALKCKGLAAVIAEVKELTFMQSRRLQLAVEASKVTGFILRTDPRRLCTTACTTRWQITPMPSHLEGDMPGVGFPRWEVDLSRVRNGKPGKWIVEWSAGSFAVIEENRFTIKIQEQIRKVG